MILFSESIVFLMDLYAGLLYEILFICFGSSLLVFGHLWVYHPAAGSLLSRHFCRHAHYFKFLLGVGAIRYSRQLHKAQLQA